jgi:hypothetical protein
MSELILAEALRAIPGVLVALPALIVAVRTLRKTRQVHKLVNGAKTELEGKLALALARIDSLERQLGAARGGRRRL